MKRFDLLVLAVLLAASGPVLGGGYIGGSFLSTDAEFETAVDNFDVDDSGWKAFFGFDIKKFVGFEVSFRDMGEFSDIVGTSALNVEIEAWEVSARGILNMGKVFNLFGKAGLARVELDGVVAEGTNPTDIGSEDWELMYGLGLGINLGKSFGIRAEWEEFDTSDDLSTFSAGVLIRF